MSTIIVNNDSTSEIFIDDLGIGIPPLSQINLTELFTKLQLTQSDDLDQLVYNQSLIVNDGTDDLTAIQGLKHINIQTEYEDHFDEIVGGGGIEIPSDPYPGQPYYDLGIPYYWDNVRQKWLSVWSIYLLSSSGGIDNMYLGISNLKDYDLGWYMHRPACITGIYCRALSGNNLKNFEIRDGSQGNLNIFPFSFPGTLIYINSNINVNLNQGSIIKVYVSGVGAPISDCMCQIEIAWRYPV